MIIFLAPLLYAVTIGCTETDNGRDYFVKGYVLYSRDGISYCLFADTCNGNIVREFYCYNGSIRYINYNCPQGCSDGRCI